MRAALRGDSRVIEGKPIADEDVLAALMDRYGRALGSCLLRRGAAPGEVEDLKQLKRSDLNEIDNIEGYLWRTASNLLVSNSRRSMLRPAHKLAIYRRNLDWFRFWLLGYVNPSPVKADQYARWRAMKSGVRK